MVPYRQDPEHIAPANQAPRCQHIRVNGRRCGSPAMRGESHCYFHTRIEDERDLSVPFPEDATSLQYGVMAVIRMLIAGHVEYKRCALLLYSLRIASLNLKGFAAERAEREGADSEKPHPSGDQKKKTDAEEEPSLAGILLGLLRTPDDGGESPVIRCPEDFYALEERNHARARAAAAGEASRDDSAGGPKVS